MVNRRDTFFCNYASYFIFSLLLTLTAIFVPLWVIDEGSSIFCQFSLVVRMLLSLYTDIWTFIPPQFTMKRRPLLHVINFLLPILFFLSLDLSSYFISDHRSEKLGFKVTVLLAISVLLLILNEILPAMSNRTPLIGSYSIRDSIVVLSLLLIPAECLSCPPHSHLQYRDLWTDVAESSGNHTGHAPPGQRSSVAEGTLAQGTGGGQH